MCSGNKIIYREIYKINVQKQSKGSSKSRQHVLIGASGRMGMFLGIKEYYRKHYHEKFALADIG